MSHSDWLCLVLANANVIGSPCCHSIRLFKLIAIRCTRRCWTRRQVAFVPATVTCKLFVVFFSDWFTSIRLIFKITSIYICICICVRTCVLVWWILREIKLDIRHVFSSQSLKLLHGHITTVAQQ